MERKRAKALLRQYRSGEATPQEKKLLDESLLSFPLGDTQLPDEESYRREGKRLWQRIAGRTTDRKTVLRNWLPYAAAAVVILAVGWFLLDIGHQPSATAHDIQPGGNKATLTLADGRVVNLDEAQSGIVIGAEDITYQDGISLGISPAETLTLTTPQGGTYAVTLPDGSDVWLNSASTLRYPSRFSGDSREVILEGEAYFEIKEIGGARVSRVPFKVQTAGQTVEVLGTQFNVSAYQDDAETKTTLVEGKVEVTSGTQHGSTQTGTSASGLRTPESAVLSPGQQATTRGAVTTVQEVDVTQYTGWKQGYFKFDGSLAEILPQVARWYDIELEYRGEAAKQVGITGIVFRDRPLSAVLEILAATTDVRFEVVGKAGERRLLVMR